MVDAIEPDASPEATTDLAGLVTNAIADVRTDFPTLVVHSHLPETLECSGTDALSYAVREIVDNAARHHDCVGTSRIAVFGTEEGGHVTLEISDNGPGIPDGELESIADGERDQLRHASSIGLWIVTWLTEMHGGTVRFKRSRGRGTTVRLDLNPASVTPMQAVGAVGFAES